MKRARSTAQTEVSALAPIRPEANVSRRISAFMAREWEVEARLRSGFLWLPIAFGLGVTLYFTAREEPALWAGPIAVLVALGFAWRMRTHISDRIMIGLVFLSLGFSAASLRTHSTGTPMLVRQGIHEASGFVESIDATPRRHRILLAVATLSDVESHTRPLRLRLGVPGAPDVKPGDFITLKARIGPPSDAAMPGGYDFRREAYFRGIGGVGYVLGRVSAATPTTEAPLGLRIFARIDDARNHMTGRIAKAIGGEAGALAAALVTGKRGLIGERTNDDLRASGLYHIVSISGLHMVLAAGVFFWTIRALLAAIPLIALRYPIKKIAAGVAMLGAVAYCLFTGSEVATERSLIMILVMLGAILIDRPALAMRNLAISALIVLAREPEALLGPSFQMSYAAVAALIAANQIWQGWRAAREFDEGRAETIMPAWLSSILVAFFASIATTAVASLATAPFGLAHFHRLNPLGIIGNTLAIPLVSLVVMPSAVAGTLLLPFGLDHLIWIAMGEGVKGVLFVAETVAAMEGAVIAVPRMPTWLFALIIAAMLMFMGLQSRLRWVSLPLLGIWLLAMRAAPIPELVVDGEGRLVLARGDAGQYRVMAQGKPSEFVLGQWLPALGDARLPADPTLRQGAFCDASGCVSRLASGGAVMLAFRLDALREDCPKARLVITPLMAEGACEGGTRLLDRNHFQHFGATRLIASDAGWVLETARNPDIQRPWMRAVKTSQLPEREQSIPASNPGDKRGSRISPQLSAEDDPALNSGG